MGSGEQGALTGLRLHEGSAQEQMPEASAPSLTATYRLQFRNGFGFAEAIALIPYLRRLGVSHVYASPLLMARASSAHGYDVVDPRRLDPALGTVSEFEDFVARLRRHGMGLILDIVPNHLAADPANPMWMDMLEHGYRSPYARFFDVEWIDTREAGRVFLVPLLEASLKHCVEARTLGIIMDVDSSQPMPAPGGFYLQHYDQRFPIHPDAWPLVIGVDRATAAGAGLLSKAGLAGAFEGNRRFREDLLERLGFLDRVDAPTRTGIIRRLLRAGPYRLAAGSAASRHYAYRRFFDINGLIGVRVEDPIVYRETMCLALELFGAGLVDGFRIDHIDGLLDPQSFLGRLRHDMEGLARDRREPYVVVEKILAPQESLRGEWPVAGTTGYEFIAAAGNVFVDRQGLGRLTREQGALTGRMPTFEDLAYKSKRAVLEHLFAGEMKRLMRCLGSLLLQGGTDAAMASSELRDALAEISCCLPVYRTYVRDHEPGRTDLAVIQAAVEEAARRNPPALGPAITYVGRLLSLDESHPLVVGSPGAALDFVLRWQQLTGPLAAKGVEDTALFRDVRLVALDEVGGDTRVPCLAVREFHLRNGTMQRLWPLGLNATTTHDTKRSEDVRARLNVLSEVPELWAERLTHWMGLNDSKRSEAAGRIAPDRHEETLLYQTLVGIWPPVDDVHLAVLIERAKAFIVKALREAKFHSSWQAPSDAYEQATTGFIEAILREEGSTFLKDLGAFAASIGWFGAVNSISEVILKVVSPGVPDFYQGCEAWALSLVDPDNRRPVDYDRNRRLLQDCLAARHRPDFLGDLLRNWQDGRVKLFVTNRSLALRRARWRLFRFGEYLEPVVEGPASGHLVAVARHLEGRWTVAVVPRLMATICGLEAGQEYDPAIWNGTTVRLPGGVSHHWLDVLSGRRFVDTSAESPRLDLADLLNPLPFALLESADGSPE